MWSWVPSDSAGPPGLRVIGRRNTLIYPWDCKGCVWFGGVWTPRPRQTPLVLKPSFLVFSKINVQRQEEAETNQCERGDVNSVFFWCVISHRRFLW